jgi:dipeptidyl aminopeptidase/acylaminoacyl peptidase
MHSRSFVILGLLTSSLGISQFAHLHASPKTAAPSGEVKRLITAKDLFDFNWVGDPEISPDGSQVIFVRVVVDEKRTGYENSIWSVATNGNQQPVRITNGKHDSHPRWSPDGHSIAFIRYGEKDSAGKRPAPQIGILSLASGEIRMITGLPDDMHDPAWSPDGKRIAFLSSTRKNISKQEHIEEPDHQSDVQIIKDYIDRTPNHVWVVDVPTSLTEVSEPVQLTSGELDEREQVWTPDGSRIYFLTNHTVEPYYGPPTTDIWSVPASGGNSRKESTIPMFIFSLSMSPNGQRVAFHGGVVTKPIRSYTQFNLWVMDLTSNAQPRSIAGGQSSYAMSNWVTGDNEAPRGGNYRVVRWSPDGSCLYDTATKEGRTPLVRVDSQSGELKEVTHGDQAVLSFSVTPDARSIVALISTPTMIGDLFTVSSDGAQHRLTDVNQKLWSQLTLTAPEEIKYTSFDGRQIQGWIQKPPDFDPNKKYPLILDIHGGPHGAYGWVFDHEFQSMAARGYVVLYPNPRGSNGYGQEFGNIIQYNFPGDDTRDLMIGVDEVLKRGYIDPKKLGIAGGSAGGALTDWIITHSNRFAAAVSMRDISNFATAWYIQDYVEFPPMWFKAPPFQDPEDYSAHSPITFVENLHTPTMFVLGENDHVVPLAASGAQLFRALKFLKRPTTMLIFPREGHSFANYGEPWHRVERLQHIVGWFDKWIEGVSHPEYDVKFD